MKFNEMDGFEIARRIRALPALANAFLVAISGYSTEYFEAQGGMVHGAAFLAKPFSLDELSERVRETLDTEWSAV